MATKRFKIHRKNNRSHIQPSTSWVRLNKAKMHQNELDMFEDIQSQKQRSRISYGTGSKEIRSYLNTPCFPIFMQNEHSERKCKFQR